MCPHKTPASATKRSESSHGSSTQNPVRKRPGRRKTQVPETKTGAVPVSPKMHRQKLRQLQRTSTNNAKRNLLALQALHLKRTKRLRTRVRKKTPGLLLKRQAVGTQKTNRMDHILQRVRPPHTHQNETAFVSIVNLQYGRPTPTKGNPMLQDDADWV